MSIDRGGPSEEEMGVNPDDMKIADEATQKSGRFYVGVEKNSDGSLDMSRAAYLKPDVETPNIPERPKLDVAFGTQVGRYFNERIKNEAGDDDHESFMVANKHALQRLSNPEIPQRADPREFTGALAELSGAMAITNPDISSNVMNNRKFDVANEKMYIASKKLFMESYRKLHSDQKVGLSGSEYSIAHQKLRDNSTIHAALEIPSEQEIDQMIKDNPKALAVEIDRLLSSAGDYAKRKAFGVHSGETSKQFVTESINRTTGSVEAIYRLQSLRDQIRTKMYGRSTVIPEGERTDYLAASERFSFAVSQLRPSLDIPRQPEWNLPDNDLERMDQVGEKLELIRREYSKDKRPPWEKKQEFEDRVRKAFV